MEQIITLLNEILTRIEKIENKINELEEKSQITQDYIDNKIDVLEEEMNKIMCSYCNKRYDFNYSEICCNCGEKVCPNCVVKQDNTKIQSFYEKQIWPYTSYCPKCITLKETTCL